MSDFIIETMTTIKKSKKAKSTKATQNEIIQDEKQLINDINKDVADFISKFRSWEHNLVSNTPDMLESKWLEFFKKRRIDKAPFDKNEIENLSLQSRYTFGLESNCSVLYWISENLQWFALEYKKWLIKEFNCNTFFEKSLIDTVVIAYCRILSLSRWMNNLEIQKIQSHEKNWFFSVMGKELDRANRHYLTALQQLQQIKAPKMNLTVKSNNAYIANNQQINQDKKSNQWNYAKQHEIIES